MRKHHHPTLKIHTIYSIALAIVLAIVFYFNRDISFGFAVVALVLYVSGNGIIHARKNVLHRDTLVEYFIIACIAGVLLVGALR